MKATVLGAGSWGTTFAQVLGDAGTPAVLWARDAVIPQARRGVPITEVVAALIAGHLPVMEAAAVLASRSAKPEWYGA